MKWFLLLAVLVAIIAPAAASDKNEKKPVVKRKYYNCECVDIIFLLDLSTSISQYEWQQVLQFICHFMACFYNPPNDVRFAAVRFGSFADVVFNLDDPCNSDGDFDRCKNIIQALPGPTDGSTDLAEGLNKIRSDIIGSKGDRDDVECPDLVIVFTDGFSIGDPKSAAWTLIREFVSIAAIGLGGCDEKTLFDIVSDNNFVFKPSFYGLLKLVDDLKVVACDTIHYDPACQTCCCGVIFGGKKKNFPDRKNKCCGPHIYDPKKATCCQGVLNEGFDERWSRCCYEQAYDPRYSTCCFYKVVPATRSQDQCCGFIAYNQKHEICCYGRVYKKSKNTACCGYVAYNRKWEICCRYNVQEGCEYDYRCCGRLSYDPRRYTCANSYYYYSYLKPSPQKYCGLDITLYCGYGTFWDPLWNTCCCGRVYPGAVDRNTGCCGTLRYELNNALCCDGYLWNVDPDWYHCCGFYFYDPWTHTCCDGYFVVPGVGLCCGPFRVFDHRSQICCGNYYVFDGRPCQTKCCFSRYYRYRPYNIKTQLCCYGYVQPGGKHYRCCGYLSYNLKTHMCCYGRIFSRKVFRLLEFCDNPFHYKKGRNPFEELDVAQSEDAEDPVQELPLTEEDDPASADNFITPEGDPEEDGQDSATSADDGGSGEDA